jgi:photosystem II stability/assembly factor-like uncharacterized protein
MTMIRAGITSSLLALAIALPSASAVTSDPYHWTNVKIIAGGFMPGIIFHPTAPGVAYARADMGGAYRLDPATRNWVPITDFMANYTETGVESIALDPRDSQRVYIVMGTSLVAWNPKGSFLRSANQGRTWERIPLPVKCGGNEDGRSIGERLAVDPQAGDVLYLGTRQDGLLRSTDRGSTWKPVASFPLTDTRAGRWPNIGVGFVVFDPRGNAPGKPTQTIYVGAANESTNLFRSIDGGATWAAVPGQPGGMIPHHAVLATNGMLYLTYANGPGPNGISDGDVWKLNTASGEWTKITPPKGAGGFAGLAVDATHPDMLMVSTMDRWIPGDDQFRSTDGGATWKAVGPSAIRDASASPYLRWGRPATEKLGGGNWEGDLEIDPTNPDRVLYVTGATVWGCDDISNLDKGQATHWGVRGQGIEETAVLSLICLPEGPRLISGISDIYGLVHDDPAISPAAGMMEPLMTSTSLDFAGLKPTVVVRVGEIPSWNKELVKGMCSADGGKTWTPLATAPVGGAQKGSIAVSADGGTMIWSPEGQPPFRTVDHGATWTAVRGIDGHLAVVADRVDPKLFYAAQVVRTGNQESSTLLRSNDGGASFTPASTNLKGRRVQAVPGLAGNLWLANGDGLYHSTDGGGSFSPITDISKSASVGFGKAAPGQSHPAVFIAGTIQGIFGLFRSDDIGSTWVRINDDQHQWGGLWGPLTGDPRTYGRFYLGTNGRGIIQGDRAEP